MLPLVGAAAPAAHHSPWVGTWAAAQVELAGADELQFRDMSGVTLRELLRTTIGGPRIRLHVSNTFGREPLVIADAAIAIAVSAGSSRINPSTEHWVTFNGRRAAAIPPGAEYVSDPIPIKVAPLTTLAVSIHFASLPKRQTGHPSSRATSYSTPGDEVTATELSGARTSERWYFLGGADVERTRTYAIAVLGDSITDGHGVVANTDTRWTDYLAERLAKTSPTAVLNLGIGGNRLLDDGVGPNAVARLDRDILSRDGVRYLIVFEGVNDLGMLTRDGPVSPQQHLAIVQQMIAGYAQIIARAHNLGIKVIGATITPFGFSAYCHPDRLSEADRRELNDWIRARGNFDAVLDFDSMLRDPSHPDRLRHEFDSGDGLHPSGAGYRFMGYGVPLSLFSED